MSGEKQFTSTGLVWMGLVMLSGEDREPVLGFDIWGYVAGRLGVDKDVTLSTAQYGRFKASLAHLEANGWIKSSGKGRTRSRKHWVTTKAGQDWWIQTGLDLHGPDRESGIVTSVPQRKWMGKDNLTPEMWNLIARGVQDGSLKIAVKGASMRGANKTKTSGGDA